MSAQAELSRRDPWIRHLAGSDDVALGAMLLANTPTNERRGPAELRRISAAATTWGARFAGRVADRPLPEGPIVHRTDGLGAGMLLARHSRAGIELFDDVIALCERVIERLGWTAEFPPGTVRAAAVAHEQAHALMTSADAADLRRAIAVPAFRVGSWTRWAHVAGAQEVAAHAFAAARLGLPRSPLLFTAAAAAAAPDKGRTR